MTWTLSELASIAEIVGLLAIVPSLLFVGAQLSRANREARAATIQAVMKSEMDLTHLYAAHASTWDKVLKGEPLADGAEMRTGIVLFNGLMADSESRFHQFEAGYLDAESWQARLSSLSMLVVLPIFKSWRDAPGGRNRSVRFLELLDDVAREADGSTTAIGRKGSSINR